MGKVPKDKRLQIRISDTLKERFEWALEQEGVDASDFITAKIMELIERAEKRQQSKKRV